MNATSISYTDQPICTFFVQIPAAAPRSWQLLFPPQGPIHWKRRPPMRTAALIVAAGRGTRAGGALPKQWQTIAGRRVADWTLDAFATHPGIDHILMVINPSDADLAPKTVATTAGGVTRAQSVLAGLQALQGHGIERVLIHDVARACVSHQVIDGVLAALATHQGAAPGLDITDALWRGTAV